MILCFFDFLCLPDYQNNKSPTRDGMLGAMTSVRCAAPFDGFVPLLQFQIFFVGLFSVQR
jgi:hypothetical protein